MPSVESLLPPEASAWILLNCPTVVMWCVIAFPVSLVLRILYLLFKRKKSGMLRLVTVLSLIGGACALTAYWMLTGLVPDIPQMILQLTGGRVDINAILKSFDLSKLDLKNLHLSETDLHRLTGAVRGGDPMTLVPIGAGTVLCLFSLPASRKKGDGKENKADMASFLNIVGLALITLGILLLFGIL